MDPSSSDEHLPSQRREDLDDFQKIQVTSSAKETLFFVSQQYHPAWRAMAGRRPLRTMLINRFYQGVILPPMTSEVELSFRPFVLWSWVPQFFFVAAAALLLLRRLLRGRHHRAMQTA